MIEKKKGVQGIARVIAWHAQSPGFNPQHGEKNKR
jgi:hypothetical protein